MAFAPHGLARNVGPRFPFSPPEGSRAAGGEGGRAGAIPGSAVPDRLKGCGVRPRRLVSRPFAGAAPARDRRRGGKNPRAQPPALLSWAKPKSQAQALLRAARAPRCSPPWARQGPPTARARSAQARLGPAPRQSRDSAFPPRGARSARPPEQVGKSRSLRDARGGTAHPAVGTARGPGARAPPRNRRVGQAGCAAEKGVGVPSPRASSRVGVLCPPLGAPAGTRAGARSPPRRAAPAPRQPRGGGFPQCPASSSPHFRCPAAHGGGGRRNRPPPRPPPAPRRRARGPARGGAGGRAGGGGARGGGRGPGAARANQQRPGARRGAGSGSAGGARARAAGAAGLERARGRAPA